MANDGILRGSFDPVSGFGAQGDDTKVWATFLNHPLIDGVASKEAGRTIKKDVVHVKIIQPGESQNQQYFQPATDADVARFPRQWAAFKANHEQEISGSPLSLLFPDNPAIVDNFKGTGCRTIEQLAELNDTALQNCGMGARGYQVRAKEYLASADKGKNFHTLSARLDQLQLQSQADKERIAALEAALAEATAANTRKSRTAA